MNEFIFKEWLYARIQYLEKRLSDNAFATWDDKMQVMGQLAALKGIIEGMGNGSFDDESVE